MSELNASNLRKEHGNEGPDLVGTTELTSPYFMVPPSGDTAERPENPEPGTLRFNTDIGSLEYFKGDLLGWETISRVYNNLSGGARALVCHGGDYPSASNQISYFNISTLGDSVDFGDTTQARSAMGSAASHTRACWMGGGTWGNPVYNIIDYNTISTLGNSADFGDLQRSDREMAGTSNAIRGIAYGGYNDGDAQSTDEIDYITIASTGNGVDFGNMLNVDYANGKGICASPTRGIISGGGAAPAVKNIISYVTIMTTGNATDFGDLTLPQRDMGSGSNSTRGLFTGGSTTGDARTNTISYITISTLGNSVDFGDISTKQSQCSTACSPTRAVTSGGNDDSGTVNTISYVEIATTGNTSDFGDLVALCETNNSVSNAHGGL